MMHSRPLAAALLLSSLAVPLRAAPAAPAEELLGSGRYEVAPAATLAWHPQAFAGKVTVAEVVKGNGPVTAGQRLVVLSADGLGEALADAKRAQAQAELAVTRQAEDLAALGPNQEAAEQKARAEAEAAGERNAYWQAKARADELQKAAGNLESAEAGVKDDREELRQLEQMYKEARIDSSTQDLVVGRERRKLRLSEANLEISRRQHKHYIEVELPQQDAALALAEKEAKLRLEATLRQGGRERTRQADALDAAKRAVVQARQKVADLEADLAALTIVAPVAGRLDGLGLAAGDDIKADQVLARIWAEQPGFVHFEAQASALPALPVGGAVRLRFPELHQGTIAGQVAEVAWQGRAEGSKTLFMVMVKAKAPMAGARPGFKVEVVK